MRRVLTLALKDLLLLWRDKFGLFWILVFPLIFALFFGSIFGGSGESGAGSMSLIVIDKDQTEGSQTFVEELDASDAVRSVARSDGDKWTVETARNAVQKGSVVAYVVIPEGFGESTFMFGPSPPELEVGIDPARQAEKGFLQGALMQASVARLQDSFTNPASMQPQIESLRKNIESDESIPELQRRVLSSFFNSFEQFVGEVDFDAIPEGDGPSFEPVTLDIVELTPEGSGPRSPYEISFPQAVAWGIIGCTAGFAISLVQERTQGTYLRLRIAPQTRAHILAGKGLACFMACVGVTLLLLVFGKLAFGLRLENGLTLALAIGCSAVCFVGLMMLMSTLGKTEQAVAGAGWAAMMPFAMLGGGMVPLFVMPDWMRTASNISPVKWAIMALEGAIWRGFTLGDMILPCAILVAIGAATFGLGVWVISRREW